MSCPRNEALSAFADRELSQRAQAKLQQHLNTCAICRVQLDAIRTLRQDLLDIPSPTLGFDLAAQLHERLPQRRRQARWPGWGLLGWMPTGLAAGAALVSGAWLGGLLLGAGTTTISASTSMTRVFDPRPPGSLCAAAEICPLPRALP